MKRLLVVVTSGLFGGSAWIVGMITFFGPAQSILADPNLQSAKFRAVMEQIEPLPRMANNVCIIIIGLLLIGIIYSIVFSFVGPKLSGSNLQKGTKFGLISWSLMVPWFEFYLPWNVMHEPILLVLLEAFCWVLVMISVGISISMAQGFLNSRK
ncbi:hypothetical protein [uncultured Croceitalea sp.]|uniref:hypothetical protein n=1 Tax=uncultured Croceitalea sp. TaxID=1798908 RepID=UPI003305A0E4